MNLQDLVQAVKKAQNYNQQNQVANPYGGLSDVQPVTGGGSPMMPPGSGAVNRLGSILQRHQQWQDYASTTTDNPPLQFEEWLKTNNLGSANPYQAR